MQNKTLSQLEIDGVPSFYIGMYGVCTHRMGLLDIPVWCKDADSVLIAMNFINNYQQPKTEPKRWTVEDQKTGRLPEVGCRIYVPSMLEEQNVIYSSEKVIVSISDNGGAVTRTEVASINRIKPIETPEEKAQRLKSEWCAKAAKQLKNLEYTSTLTSIYDAILSG